MQYEHRIQDFDRLKAAIDENTYEIKKKRKKSRIKAKTLESNKEDIEDSELKELLEYAETFYPQELDIKQIKAQDIIDQINIGNKIKKEDKLEESEFEEQDEDKEDDLSNAEDCLTHVKQKKQLIEEDQLKELMRNINIICMMENN